jgi:ketosteroid isomerase-like protein
VSRENVEIMEAALEAFNRRDGDAFGALLDCEAEIIPVRAELDGTTFRGSRAGAEYCAVAEATWIDLRWDVDEVRDGNDWVLALGRIRGTGRESGVAINTRGGWVARFHAGRITHFQTHSDRAKALEAVGLSV